MSCKSVLSRLEVGREPNGARTKKNKNAVCLHLKYVSSLNNTELKHQCAEMNSIDDSLIKMKSKTEALSPEPEIFK